MRLFARNLIGISATLLSCVASIAACGQVDTSVVTPAEAGADAAPEDAKVDAADAAPATCARGAGDECVGGGEDCCTLNGRLADLDAGCLARRMVPIACSGCVFAATPGCYFRVVDGRQEAFWTSGQGSLPYPTNLKPCDLLLAGEVSYLGEKPACP